MKKIFLIVAFSFGIYFTSCNKKVKTSTEVKLTIEKVFQENLLSFEKYNICPCGYFVSTTLNHIGLKLNRYKLAQKSSDYGAKTIQSNKK